MGRFLGAILVAVALTLALPLPVDADQYVRGYYRQDGYVAPHMRSSPNSSYNDNW